MLTGDGESVVGTSERDQSPEPAVAPAEVTVDLMARDHADPTDRATAPHEAGVADA